MFCRDAALLPKRGDAKPKGAYAVRAFEDVADHGGGKRDHRVDIVGADGARLCVAAPDAGRWLTHAKGGK